MGMDEVRGGQAGHCQEGSMVLLVSVEEAFGIYLGQSAAGNSP